MADLNLGVRLSADGSGLVGQVNGATKALDGLTTAEKGAATAAKTLEGATKVAAGAITQVGASSAAAAAQAELNFKRINTAIQNAVREQQKAVGQMRAASANLGQQIGDIAQGLAAGTNPLTIFAQQGGQVAFAMSGMGGAIGRVATFLSGPWGAALLGGTIVLGSLAKGLFDTKDTAKEAEKAIKAFADRQGDISNFVDKATGAIKEQNKTLIANAILLRQATIAENAAKIKKGTTDAFKAAGEAAGVGNNKGGFVAERQPFRDRLDPQISAAISAANGDVEKLDVNLRALSKARPELAKVAAEINNGAAAAVLAAQENKKLTGEIDLLTGKTKAAGTASAGLVEKQVALATATTAVERARARYNLVLTKGDAAEKGGAKAVEAYRVELTAAAAAVNKAEAAADASRKAITGNNKALREAARDAREATKEALEFAKAVDGGRLAIANGAPPVTGLAIGNAVRAQDAERSGDTLSALTSERSVAQNDKINGIQIGKSIGDAFSKEALEVSQLIGQGIGGSFGRAIQQGGAIGALLSRAGGTTPGGGGGIGGVFSKGFQDTIKGAFKPVTNVLNGVFKDGGKLTETIGKAAGKALGGAAVGGAVSDLAGAVGIKLSKTGTKIGGALGGLSGIPGGALIGSVLGGIIGNLFGKPKGSTTVSSSGGDVSQSGSGNKAIQAATGGLGKSITSALAAITQQLGGTQGAFSVSIGKEGDRFRVDTAGKGRTDKRQSGVLAFDTDEAAALSAAIADAIKDGAVQGLSTAVQQALQSSTDIDAALRDAVKVQNVEDLLGGFAASAGRAFREFEKQAADRLRIASKYGFDIVKLEKTNGEQRAALFKEVLQQQTGSLQAVLDNLKFGDLADGSAVDRRNRLEAEVVRLQGESAAGVAGANDKLAKALEDFANASRDAFGTAGGGFAGDRSRVQSIAETVIARTTADLTAAQAAAALPEKLATLQDENNAQNAQMISILTSINASFGSGFGGVVAGPVEIQRPVVRLT